MVEQLTPPDDDPLPATKLRLPRERAGTMSRPRLVHRLTDATTRELTLVCAPAGFGKTTLVADWARLRDVAGATLDDGAVDTLTRRTEGWAAGLQLAGLSLRDHPDPDGFVENFSGSHRHVLDYLAEEVLARQPDEVVRFLLETSVLDQVSGPLGEAVTGRGDSQALLERIERANLFLVPLDDVRGWWRYHRLLADLLQARLRHAQPDRVPELHRAAAGWWEGPGPDAGRGQWPAAEHAIPARAGRRGSGLGGTPGRMALRRGLPPCRGGDPGEMARGHAGRGRLLAAAEHVGRLLRSFGRAAPSAAGRDRGAAPGLVEPLTDREMDVLELLAAGTSNQQIADQLFVALVTAKKHVSRILDKLGAANRTEAVARARGLGLLR